MIGIIKVLLTKGSLSANQLHALASGTGLQEEDPSQVQRAQEVQKYIAPIIKRAVYICVPHAGAQASFIHMNKMEFEVVIQTFKYGNLLRAAESIDRALRRRLKLHKLKADIHIELNAIGDAQTVLPRRK